MGFRKNITLREARFIIKMLRKIHSYFLKYVKDSEGDGDMMLLFANELAEFIFKLVVEMKKKFGKHIYLPL